MMHDQSTPKRVHFPEPISEYVNNQNTKPSNEREAKKRRRKSKPQKKQTPLENRKDEQKPQEEKSEKSREAAMKLRQVNKERLPESGKFFFNDGNS